MPGSVQEEITQLLLTWTAGDTAALPRLMEAVHGRLSELASRYLRSERANHTLETGALVNEAFLRLIRQERVRWRDRAHFFAISAKIMRRILVDHARRGEASKRGPGWLRRDLEGEEIRADAASPDVLALDDALRDLEEIDPELSELVSLRYFGGLTKDELAEVMGISTATVARRWRTARAWLFTYLVEGEADEF